MARLQRIITLPSVTIAVAGTPQPLSSSDLFVKSFTMQANPLNTGVVTFGDASSQSMSVAAGRAVMFQGDNMDNGTAARLNVAEVYVTSTVPGDVIDIISLENL